MKGPILAVDPGEKRIGVAISDPSASLARPLTVIRHEARLVDAAAVASLAAENHAVSIIVGQALDSEGNVGPAGRKAARFAEALRSQTEIPVELWDESGSTQRAREIQIRLGVPRQKRKGHLDEHAAAAILQSYLDENWSS